LQINDQPIFIDQPQNQQRICFYDCSYPEGLVQAGENSIFASPCFLPHFNPLL